MTQVEQEVRRILDRAERDEGRVVKNAMGFGLIEQPSDDLVGVIEVINQVGEPVYAGLESYRSP